MRMIFLVAILAIYLPSLALEVGPYRLDGIVKSFDSQFIVVDTNDVIVKIPRAFVSEKLSAGKMIHLLLLPEQKSQLKIQRRNKTR